MTSPLLRTTFARHLRSRPLHLHAGRSADVAPSTKRNTHMPALWAVKGRSQPSRGIATSPLRSPKPVPQQAPHGKQTDHEASRVDSKGASGGRDQAFKSEIPAFNFKDLGANKTVKTVVIIALIVAGTAETITWCRLGLRRWRGREGSSEEQVDLEEKGSLPTGVEGSP
ncbi:hypothetical protein BDZ85DRAFT_264065 [Elsinoe ampelina]|uniref:Uncharacterized protein n=1 Tax=Elsinoe ampelina TaxID=302913 RepID=A0A6A6GAE2_9PEZI|nr:hypothetical protein BDZ85DRAFT_264065 [Elsinoe ampelina]